MDLNKTFIKKKYKNSQPLHVSSVGLQPKKTAAMSRDLKGKGCTENLRGKETHSNVKLGKFDKVVKIGSHLMLVTMPSAKVSFFTAILKSWIFVFRTF